MNEQWLWEKCGLVAFTDEIGVVYEYEQKLHKEPPSIDLNKLFLYAVPLLEGKLGYKEAYMLLLRWITEVVAGKDPADSLFQAIYKAFGGE